jgi:signal transduction histidine kinase
MSFVQARLFQTESFRLAAIYAGLFLGSMALLMAVIYLIVSHAFEASLLRAATDDLKAIRTAYNYADGPKRRRPLQAAELHEAEEIIDDRLLAHDDGDLFLLLKDGKKVAGNLPVMKPVPGMQSFAYVTQGGTAQRMLLGRGEQLRDGAYAFVGRDLESLEKARGEVLTAFMIVFGTSLVLAGVGGVVLSRSFVQRLDAITATCRSIMSGRLKDRIPAKGTRNELDQLAASINAMLDRIEALMESLKQVTNDIAHDMRTPLAHLRYRLEGVRSEATSIEDYEIAVDRAIEESDTLLAMFAALLRIAQIEAGARQAGMQEVDFTSLMDRVACLYKPVMEDALHPFTIRIEEGLKLRGDPQLLIQLFSNLLDNAIRHTPKGAEIALCATTTDAGIGATVEDCGEGIPAEDRTRVFRRFFRREKSRTKPGSGLGLALVAAVVELHAGTIRLEDNKPGLRAKVNFPAAA